MSADLDAAGWAALTAPAARQVAERIARSTTPTRTVTVPPLLVAVNAMEAGVSPCPPDHPDIQRVVGDMRRVGQSPPRFEWHNRARAELSADGAVTPGLADRPAHVRRSRGRPRRARRADHAAWVRPVIPVDIP